MFCDDAPGQVIERFCGEERVKSEALKVVSDAVINEVRHWELGEKGQGGGGLRIRALPTLVAVCSASLPCVISVEGGIIVVRGARRDEGVVAENGVMRKSLFGRGDRCSDVEVPQPSHPPVLLPSRYACSQLAT